MGAREGEGCWEWGKGGGGGGGDGDCLGGDGIYLWGGMDGGRVGVVILGGAKIDFMGVFWGVGAFLGDGWCGYTGKIILPLYAH